MILRRSNSMIRRFRSTIPVADKTISKIEAFSKLEIGWDFGLGVPASHKTVLKAIRFYKEGIRQGFKSDARPSTDGGIILCFYIDDNFIYITLNPNGSYDFRYEKGIGENYEILIDTENATLEYINDTIKNLKSQWLLLEHYTSVNMTQTAGDFQVIALKNTVKEYQFLTNNAPELQVKTPYAIIYQYSMPEQSEYLQYFAK